MAIGGIVLYPSWSYSAKHGYGIYAYASQCLFNVRHRR